MIYRASQHSPVDGPFLPRLQTKGLWPGIADTAKWRIDNINWDYFDEVIGYAPTSGPLPPIIIEAEALVRRDRDTRQDRFADNLLSDLCLYVHERRRKVGVYQFPIRMSYDTTTEEIGNNLIGFARLPELVDYTVLSAYVTNRPLAKIEAYVQLINGFADDVDKDVIAYVSADEAGQASRPVLRPEVFHAVLDGLNKYGHDIAVFSDEPPRDEARQLLATWFDMQEPEE